MTGSDVDPSTASVKSELMGDVRSVSFNGSRIGYLDEGYDTLGRSPLGMANNGQSKFIPSLFDNNKAITVL